MISSDEQVHGHLWVLSGLACLDLVIRRYQSCTLTAHSFQFKLDAICRLSAPGFERTLRACSIFRSLGYMALQLEAKLPSGGFQTLYRWERLALPYISYRLKYRIGLYIGRISVWCPICPILRLDI
jgi:hypothetical protein